MKQEFTNEFMRNNCGCYSTQQLLKCSFMQGNPATITLESILNSTISLKDKYWFVCKKVATKQQNQQIAIAVAEIVQVIFENKYPDDKRPREAIQAAKDYLTGTITRDDLLIKRKAAAYAAAYDAYDAAADAAAYAAYAADAAYAAYAAADAADADAAGLKVVLLTFLKNFCLTPQKITA